MNYFSRFKFMGGRIIKTGIAVLLTAIICQILDWPAMFAVITAIVTIEPTAANSIKKAYVRFPATAIGAAYSIGFNIALGESPYTYALVAITTIITCHKLHLNDGTLVATLTGVAMISTVHDHFIASYFIRLGSTSVGLTVSTLVNLFMMSPKYSPIISLKIHRLLLETGSIIDKRGREIVKQQSLHQETRSMFQTIFKKIEEIETLCQYQKEEWKYHRFSRKEMINFHYDYKKLNILRQIIYHVGNLISFPTHQMQIETEKITLLKSTVRSVKEILHSPNYEIADEHHELVTNLLDEFKQAQSNLHKDDEKYQHRCFSSDTVIFYELLSINDLLEELNHVHNLELSHQKLLKHSMTS